MKKLGEYLTRSVPRLCGLSEAPEIWRWCLAKREDHAAYVEARNFRRLGATSAPNWLSVSFAGRAERRKQTRLNTPRAKRVRKAPRLRYDYSAAEALYVKATQQLCSGNPVCTEERYLAMQKEARMTRAARKAARRSRSEVS